LEISAIYLCPVRGVAALDPPETDRLEQAARAARDLGLRRLLIPVLEESLLGATRETVRFLDGLVAALDRLTDASVDAWMVAPAQNILGIYWVPPYLVSPTPDISERPVFVEGKLRNLRPYKWWADPSLAQKRLKVFHELVIAVNEHPALKGWIVMDRELEWSRPDVEAADLLLRSYLGEIRDHNESSKIYLGLGWHALLEPGSATDLAPLVDGIKINGLDERPKGLRLPDQQLGEILLGAYVGSLGQWLLESPVELVISWRLTSEEIDWDRVLELVPDLFSGRGISGVIWPTLIDPEPSLFDSPPWSLGPKFKGISLLNSGVEPKDHVEALLKGFQSCTPEERKLDFIDISREEYMEDPDTHFKRLWNHLRESVDL